MILPQGTNFDEKVRLDNNAQAFFALVRLGLLCHTDTTESTEKFSWDGVDWGEVYRLAEEQSVLGIISAGIEELRAKSYRANVDFKIPQEWALQFIGQTLQIEQRNKEMNAFVADLIEKLRDADIYAIIVKGQGIAQCYEKPLWRTCGDVDLLLSDTNYEKAKAYLVPLADRTETEFKIFKHYGMTINGWEVELHGTLRPRLSNRIDRGVDEVQNDVFFAGNVRSEEFKSSSGLRVQIFMPAPDDDIIFQITHILKHFYQGGIGLRQLCDLSRFIWIYRDKLNHSLLEARLKKMGIIAEWKAFAAFIHEYLGTPAEVIPLLDISNVQEFKSKADKICDFVMEVGNFGHNRVVHGEGFKVNGFIARKAVSLCWRTKDSFRHFSLFPVNSIKVWFHVLWTGLVVAVRGK